MKVAYVYDAVYPWEKGGAQKRVWELARRLADDHDVHLYGMHYWDGPSVLEREGVTLHGVCEPYELYAGGRRSISQALLFAARVAPHLLRADADVVDCQAFPYFPVFPAKAAALARDATLLVTWYEVWDDYWLEYLGAAGHAGRAVERAAVRLADEVVAISDHIRDDLRTIGRTRDVSVVPNGVDYRGVQDVPPAAADWDVVYVGRLAEHKNLELLLDALAELRERGERVSCGIVGDGPERDRLEDHAERVGVADRVSFLGFLEADEDVVGHLKAADLFVLPSTREGFPNTILEANACGVPSVVVDHPENGARAVVEDGRTGLVVDGSVGSMADAVHSVLASPDLRADLSAGADAFARDHDWDRVADQLERRYYVARGARP